MDKQSQEKLDELLATDINALTDEDKAFLRARRSYIPVHLQDQYADVLADLPAQTEEAPIEDETTSTEETEPVEVKPKKAKKAK